MESEGSLTTFTSDSKTNEDNNMHMQLLEEALNKTSRKCVSSFKFSLLKRHFAPVYKKDPKTLLKLHEDAVKELSSNIQEEISVMLEEEKIDQLMMKLSRLKEQSENMSEDITAWRPSGHPEEDVMAHIQPVHSQHLVQLQKVFDQLMSQNTLLQKNVQKQRDKLMQSRAELAEHLDTWKKANCLSDEDCQEIEHFILKHT